MSCEGHATEATKQMRSPVSFTRAETDSPSCAQIFIDILQDINEDALLRKDAARILGLPQENIALEPLMTALSDARSEKWEE